MNNASVLYVDNLDFAAREGAAVEAANGATVDGRKIGVRPAAQAPMLKMWLARNPEDFPDEVRKQIG